MFKKNEDTIGKIDTLIGSNTKFSGKIEAKGAIRIDGELDGDVIVEGNVTIGPEGKIIGNITCSSIYISGTVKGNIHCREQLRLGNTAKLIGDAEVKTLIVDENAIFDGKCKMEGTSDTTMNDRDTKKENKKHNS
ncbi:Polymer-forming protein [Proteiniborus ethanoligenes]|uniref:Polymer-forming protein n=1 Tax=Proteiniborus ethanoligenes TaxID=415015 RepID=A0A1H3LAD0_9FIRM|nr:polymer-forming cytoskeletal protein [Proteiniborus ethanoligenes]SDY61236.1 Polymer-forming protein [Proteiniborus ethanoligenes]